MRRKTRRPLKENNNNKTIGNTQINILLLCFLYLFVELMITINEYNFVQTNNKTNKQKRKQ